MRTFVILNENDTALTIKEQLASYAFSGTSSGSDWPKEKFGL